MLYISIMENDKKIIIHLRELRKSHNLSQDELAESLGVSRQSIIALERGKYMPSLPLALSLCDFFDAAFDEVFQFENEMNDFCNNMPSKENVSEIKSKQDDQNNNQLIKREDKMFDLGPLRPLRESVSLRDAIDRLFEDSIVTTQKLAPMPRIDIQDKKNEVVVKAELPGVDEADVNVEISENVMTISGEKKQEMEEKEEEKGYYYKESYSGSFTRSFALPAEVAADKAEAEMVGGILTISIPKIQPKKPRKISIKTKK